MNQKPSAIFIIIMALVSMLPPLAIDMYLPSFLDIARDLNVSQEKVQTTLATFTFGFAAGQLFWGPMADSFGRKPMILIGILGSALAAYFLTQVDNIENFYWLRLMQGLFGAAPAVVMGALMRDLFERNYFAKIMSTIMIITMIAPLVAPILGGYLAKFFHWHSIFLVLMGLGLVCATLVGSKIPETLKAENRVELSFKQVFLNFKSVLTNKAVLGYVLAGGFAFAGMFSFLTSGSLIYIGLYGVSPENFGYFFILNISVMIVMNLINGRFVTKIGSEKMLQIGLSLQFIAGIWLAIVATFQLGLWAMAVGVAVFVGMVGTISSNATVAILDKFPQMAGTANAVAGTMRFGIGSAVGAMLSLFTLTSEKPMLYTMTSCVLISVLIYRFLSYQNTKQATV